MRELIDKQSLIEALTIDRLQNEKRDRFKKGIAHGLTFAISIIQRRSNVDLWIPCKKRLPDDDMRVLVDDGRQIEVMKWDLMRGRFYDNHAHDYDRSEILAWMPLPEPYKESENE